MWKSKQKQEPKIDWLLFAMFIYWFWIMFCYVFRSLNLHRKNESNYKKKLVSPSDCVWCPVFRFYYFSDWKRKIEKEQKKIKIKDRMILVSFGSAGVDWIAPAKIFRQTLEIAPAAHICDKNRYQFSELDCSFIDFIIYISFRLIELVLLASPIRFCFVSFFFSTPSSSSGVRCRCLCYFVFANK